MSSPMNSLNFMMNSARSFDDRMRRDPSLLRPSPWALDLKPKVNLISNDLTLNGMVAYRPAGFEREIAGKFVNGLYVPPSPLPRLPFNPCLGIGKWEARASKRW